MILQMNTTNKKCLLEELAHCCGSVAAVLPDNTRCDARTALLASKEGRGIPLRLTLQIQQPSDYMRLACFAIGDL